MLDWHERRMDVILLAERLAVSPPDNFSLSGPRQLTARTMPQVQNAIDQLFRWRGTADSAAEQDAAERQPNKRRQSINNALRQMRFYFDLLRAYGITAEMLEQAEEQFHKLCPVSPPLASYEQMMERIKAGDEVSPEAIKNALEDLLREERILKAKRRESVRAGQEEAKKKIDQSLLTVRRSSTYFRKFLSSIGINR